MNRRAALKVLGGTAAGVAVAGVGGLVWLKRWADPHTPLDYAFPAGAGFVPTRGAAHLQPTDAETEGPFYTPHTPLRTAIAEAGTPGTPLAIAGRVVTTDGRPIRGAVLDVWNCDGRGVYDNDGFNLRGHQFTDDEGRFRVDTVKPADYRMAGIHRTPHVHIKAQGPGTRLLTTQLYFPGEPLNAHDRFFDPDLVVAMQPAEPGRLAAAFTFVLELRDSP